MGQLNAVGYLVFFIVAGAGLALWGRRSRAVSGRPLIRLDRLVWRRYVRRFSRPLPLIFAVAALAAFLGGALHSPNNYDALVYRLPRILMWWDHSGWNWFSTPTAPMNYSAADFEWLMMPSIVLAHTDRLLFLINFAGYLFMPGLLFSVFVGAGVARRVAWAWMWLLPMGFCYLLEAASVGNDTLAATFVLAAIHFGFLSRRTGRHEYLGLALLAAGLATGTKAVNLPLLLPICAAVWPSLRLLGSRLLFGLAAILAGLAVSFCPTAALNVIYTGSWTGDPHNEMGAQPGSASVGIIANSLQLAEGWVSPPFCPYPQQVSDWIANRLPERLMLMLKRDFPRLVLQVREMPQEEAAGLGLGITLLLAGVALTKGGPQRGAGKLWLSSGMGIGILAWAGLAVYMAKIGSEATARLVSAYYPLMLIPILLLPNQRLLVRKRWWKAIGIASGAASFLVLVLSPSRPLWPAMRISAWLERQFPGSAEIARVHTVYAVYEKRSDLFASLGRQLPDGVSTLGVIGANDQAYSSLWKPYGGRAVRFLQGVQIWGHAGVTWLIVNKDVAELSSGESFDRWLQETGGGVVASELIWCKASREPDQWYVVHWQGKENSGNGTGRGGHLDDSEPSATRSAGRGGTISIAGPPMHGVN